MYRLSCLLVLCAACNGPDADVEGNYTVALTNRDNGCNLAMWTVGEQTTGIPVAITQEGTSLAADVGGGAQIALDFALGSHIYTGEVDGTAVLLTILGTRSQSSGNCTFTYNSVIASSLDGDVLTGRIDYRAATNGNPDCAAITGCVSFQDFNGTRPPQ